MPGQERLIAAALQFSAAMYTYGSGPTLEGGTTGGDRLDLETTQRCLFSVPGTCSALYSSFLAAGGSYSGAGSSYPPCSQLEANFLEELIDNDIFSDRCETPSGLQARPAAERRLR